MKATFQIGEKMKNNDVAKSWAKGNVASGSNYQTDGQNLYSYQKLIGYTDIKGRKHVIDNGYISKTTSRHVNQAKRAIGKLK